MDSLQCRQSVHGRINSSHVNFRQQPGESQCLNLQSLKSRSDLHQSDLVGVCVAVDAEDEGVFVGVMLDDVIVHVHQDPKNKRVKFHWLDSEVPQKPTVGISIRTHPFLLFLYTLAILSVATPYFSDICQMT